MILIFLLFSVLCVLICILALPLTDDAWNQREIVWCQPQSQVYGLTVIRWQQCREFGIFKVTTDITLVNKSLKNTNHEVFHNGRYKGINRCFFFIFVLIHWILNQQVHLDLHLSALDHALYCTSLRVVLKTALNCRAFVKMYSSLFWENCCSLLLT